MTGQVTNDPALVAKIVNLFTDTATSDLIANLDATVTTIPCGNTTLPMTISDGPNCYICDPTIGYIDYAAEETRHFAQSPTLRLILLGLIKTCRPLLKATGLDHQVQPNNWLFSTNPVPTLTPKGVTKLRDDLVTKHPKRAIIIRSLNRKTDADTIAALQSAGFILLPARQVYLFDGSAHQKPNRDMKNDAGLKAKCPYQIVSGDSFSADDFTRAETLYRLLYLDKYTPLNPQYTAQYLTQAQATGVLQIIGLRGPDGTLDGIIGLFQNGNTLTVPLLGYDTSKPLKTGLYRILNAIIFEHAIQHKLLHNMSAGAASFKRNRQAKPAIEYSAVYVAHLGHTSRAATRLAKFLLDQIGVPIMQRFAL